MSTSPCLFAFPAFDRVAGLYNRTLNLTGEYAYGKDFEVKLRALNDLAKDYGLGGPGPITGGINFGCLAVWDLIAAWFSRKLKVCEYFQALR
jgi:hypothetical protein